MYFKLSCHKIGVNNIIKQGLILVLKLKLVGLLLFMMKLFKNKRKRTFRTQLKEIQVKFGDDSYFLKYINLFYLYHNKYYKVFYLIYHFY